MREARPESRHGSSPYVRQRRRREKGEKLGWGSREIGVPRRHPGGDQDEKDEAEDDKGDDRGEDVAGGEGGEVRRKSREPRAERSHMERGVRGGP